MQQKKYLDIDCIREEETEFRATNTDGFEVGDIIQISEKIDGSNAMICYDPEIDGLASFSRNKSLTFDNTLNGFWNYAKYLNVTPFRDHPTWCVFGEWSNRNKIIYDERFTNKWIIYDIFDKETKCWLQQDKVKRFSEDSGIEYIHVFYWGPFISWEHARTFMNMPQYGDRQEGIVVKNLSKLDDMESRLPVYLKIVNESFKESLKTKSKPKNSEEDEAKVLALELARSIVTLPRVEKQIFKARDDGQLPERLSPQDIGKAAKIIPKRVYEDCLKEEKEIVEACGKYFNKACGSLTMKFVREIIGV